MQNIGIETENREYKKTTGEIKEAINSIVAILNKHGSGELYFGVRNNGDILGLDINDETLRKVSQAIKNHITPTIYPDINVEEFEDEKKVRELELGDIIICVDILEEHAIEYKTGILREMLYMITHGVCHLLGYDHEVEEEKKEMRALEEKILNKIGVGQINE